MSDKAGQVVGQTFADMKKTRRPEEPGELGTFTLKLPKNHMAILNEEAKRLSLSRAAMVRQAIREFIEHNIK